MIYTNSTTKLVIERTKFIVYDIVVKKKRRRLAFFFVYLFKLGRKVHCIGFQIPDILADETRDREFQLP